MFHACTDQMRPVVGFFERKKIDKVSNRIPPTSVQLRMRALTGEQWHASGYRHMAVRQIVGYANQMAARHTAVIPTKWSWGVTTGMTTLWREAPQKWYPETKGCLARGHAERLQDASATNVSTWAVSSPRLPLVVKHTTINSYVSPGAKFKD